ncbi:MAG TPA: helix-turn-helix transcriptional regulator [Kofleriaceae bacterium]|nr:helix-turn-helix transcriptional regulator [Kofleriaceae bacterium]
MTDTQDGRERRRDALVLGVLGAMTLLLALDLAEDIASGATAFHVALESVLVALGLLTAGSIALHLRRLAQAARDLRARTRTLEASLAASQAEAEHWRRDAADLIAGLGAAIDAQFARWGLTPAQREIALLLLKGLSHKEIAQLRDVNETTVRQQARALYQKAGLSGRSDLAAFFLEDLLSPPPAPPRT